jgi:hypothetical protein
VFAVLLALTPASAHAATPVTLGPGVEPGVTVVQNGTAYIAWIGHETDPTSLHFCRLPRNATACEVNQQIAVPGTSLTRPFVTVNGSTVRVYSYRYGLTSGRFDAIYALTSTNDGATFDAGVQVGTNGFYDAIIGPGSGVSFIANNSSIYQRVPDDASTLETTEARLADDHPYTPSIANTGGAGMLAVFANGSGNAQFRLYNAAGDPNDASVWTPAQDFSTLASYLRLASGPAGTFLQSDDGPGNIVVQKFNGAGFDAPVTIPGPAHELTGGSKDMTQDASGRLHMVWPFGDVNGNHIGYATSDDGASWQTGSFESGPKPADIDQTAGEMRLSVAPDHLGVAAWQSSGSDPQVRAIAVGPVAIAPPAIGKTASAAPVKGTVLVKLKGKDKFAPLKAGATVPLGSTFDTTNGTVALDTSAGAGKPLQHGQFNGGQFTVQQSRKNPLTTLSMTGAGLNKCKARLPKGGAAKKRSRTLFSSVKGHFRTRGRNSAATVRGTKYTVTDSCAGTLTIVKQGSVVVRDFTLRKNKTLRTGQRYLARPPRTAQRRGNR